MRANLGMHWRLAMMFDFAYSKVRNQPALLLMVKSEQSSFARYRPSRDEVFIDAQAHLNKHMDISKLILEECTSDVTTPDLALDIEIATRLERLLGPWLDKEYCIALY